MYSWLLPADQDKNNGLELLPSMNVIAFLAKCSFRCGRVAVTRGLRIQSAINWANT